MDKSCTSWRLLVTVKDCKFHGIIMGKNNLPTVGNHGISIINMNKRGYLLLWLYNYYGFCPSTNCFSDLAIKSLPSVSGPCCDQTWAKRPPIPSYPPNRMINSPSNEISVSYNTDSCYSYNCSVLMFKSHSSHCDDPSFHCGWF